MIGAGIVGAGEAGYENTTNLLKAGETAAATGHKLSVPPLTDQSSGEVRIEEVIQGDTSPKWYKNKSGRRIFLSAILGASSKQVQTKVIDNKLKIIDDVPSSAVEMAVKEKVFGNSNRFRF